MTGWQWIAMLGVGVCSYGMGYNEAKIKFLTRSNDRAKMVAAATRHKENSNEG